MSPSKYRSYIDLSSRFNILRLYIGAYVVSAMLIEAANNPPESR